MVLGRFRRYIILYIYMGAYIKRGVRTFHRREMSAAIVSRIVLWDQSSVSLAKPLSRIAACTARK